MHSQKALVNKGASLLPSGVIEVSGHFSPGDAIEIHCGKQVLGKGIALYGAQELRQIKGAKSAQINTILGYDSGEVIVHRDDLVLFKP